MVDLHGNSMKLEDIRFPLYVVHSDEVMRRDGILWIDGAVLDDTNVEGQSIGERRLRTPLKNMYDLKHQIDNFGGLIKHRGRFYVDSNGKFFIYEKSVKADLKYHLIPLLLQFLKYQMENDFDLFHLYLKMNHQIS